MYGRVQIVTVSLIDAIAMMCDICADNQSFVCLGSIDGSLLTTFDHGSVAMAALP